jgi:rhodanese-related sulfurtransferase
MAALVTWSATGFTSGKEDIPRMKVEELKSLLGSPDVVVLDVRLGGEIAPKRILGSVFENPEKVDAWSSKYPKRKKIVLYCS